MDLTIVIPSYNTKKYTLDCINSILENVRDLGYEIIVVDNNSTDGSGESLEKISKKNKKVSIITNTKNLGFAKAANQGIKRAKGKYVLLLNSDTKVKRNSIENLLNFAERNEDVGVIGSRLVNEKGKVQASVFHFPTVWGAIKEFWFGKRGAMYFEDLDYCRRAWKSGLKVFYLPISEMVHHHGVSGKKIAKTDEQWKRLIPSSKIYYGLIKYYLIFLVMWLGQQCKKLNRVLRNQKKKLSCSLKNDRKDESWIVVFLFLLTIPSFIAIVRKYFFPVQDYVFLTRIYEMQKALFSGQFPVRWVSGLRYGEPLFNYYAPLPYYIGGLSVGLGLNLFSTVKLLLVASLFLSALAMYFLGKELFGKYGGIVSAVLYTYAPYRALDIYVRGAFSEIWTFVLYPLIFLFSLKFVKEKTFKNLLYFSLSVACLFLTHNISTIIFLPFLAIWLLFLSWREKKNLFYYAMALMYSFLLSSSYLLPAFFERGFIQTQHLTSGYFNYRGHFVALRQLFIPFWGYGSSTWGTEDTISLQLGLVQWGIFFISLVGVIYLYLKKKKNKIGLLMILLFMFLTSLFLQHSRSTPIWEAAKIFDFVQFPWRFMAISIFIISLVGGCLVNLVNKKILFSIVITTFSILFTFNYFRPVSYCGESMDSRCVSLDNLTEDKHLPQDYLPIWVKRPSQTERFKVRTEKGDIQIVSFLKKSNSLTTEIKLDNDNIIEFPIFYFPGWQAKIDDNFVKVLSPTNNGLIRLGVSKGLHNVQLRFTDTPIRKFGNFLSLGALVILIVMIVKRKVIKL